MTSLGDVVRAAHVIDEALHEGRVIYLERRERHVGRAVVPIGEPRAVAVVPPPHEAGRSDVARRGRCRSRSSRLARRRHLLRAVQADAKRWALKQALSSDAAGGMNRSERHVDKGYRRPLSPPLPFTPGVADGRCRSPPRHAESRAGFDCPPHRQRSYDSAGDTEVAHRPLATADRTASELGPLAGHARRTRDTTPVDGQL